MKMPREVWKKTRSSRAIGTQSLDKHWPNLYYYHIRPHQCVTRSLFQFSRREREFLSFNLVLRDENENLFFQSQASRRERESRMRQFLREFSGIIFIACLLIDIFKKRLLISQNLLKLYLIFSREI